MTSPPKDEGALETARVLHQSQRQPITEIPFRGQSLKIFPNVFSPAYFEDSLFFAETIPVRFGDVFLEVGTGTGIIAIALAKRGAARGVALDLAPAAVKNAKENSSCYGLAACLEVRQSDVFTSLRADERFDLIFWNVPFANQKPRSLLEYAIFDEGYEAIKRYVAGAEQYLRPQGRLLLGFSDTLGQKEYLEQLCRMSGYRLQIIKSQNCQEGILMVTMDLYELTRVL